MLCEVQCYTSVDTLRLCLQGSCDLVHVRAWTLSHSVMSYSLPPMDCNLPGSSVRGILQARILEWVAIPVSTGSSQPRD